MNLLRNLATRFSRADITQLSTLLFTLLVIALIFAWPTSNLLANNSWDNVAQLRLLALSLLAIGYGGALSAFPDIRNKDAAVARERLLNHKRAQRSTLAALVSLAVLSSPLEIAAYAASYPPQPLWWSLVLALIDTVAMFGLGLGLGKLLETLRLSLLLPLAVPATLAGLIALDLVMGIPLGSPLAALTGINYAHLALMSLLALFTVYLLSQPAKLSPGLTETDTAQFS